MEPTLAEVTAESGLYEVETYAYRHHNTVSQYISTRAVMYLYILSERRPGTRVYKRWWEWEGLYLERNQMEAQEAER